MGFLDYFASFGKFYICWLGYKSMRKEINRYIVIDSEICHGKPTFKGTRIMVWQVLEMLEGGLSIKEIIKDFPSLTPKAIKAALKYAAEVTRGRDNVIVSVSKES